MLESYTRRGPEVQNESQDWSRAKDRIFQRIENKASEEGCHSGGDGTSTELEIDSGNFDFTWWSRLLVCTPDSSHLVSKP